MSAPADIPEYAVNLRRLFAWHLQTNRDVAVLLGASEHSVSGWVTGKREPGTRFLKAIGELYGVDAIKMLRDPEAFGLDIADPERYHRAEERISVRLATR